MSKPAPDSVPRLFAVAEFLASAGKLEELPPDDRPEVAFCGRSNVGKSSAINILCGRRRLAFTSKTPGRTQTVNVYGLGARGRLVDLPGYGYARLPDGARAHWDALVGGYLTGRRGLAGVVLLMDARHGLTANDARFVAWVTPLERPLAVLLTKADKLTRREQAAALAAARQALPLAGTVILFSSLSGQGVMPAREWIADRLG